MKLKTQCSNCSGFRQRGSNMCLEYLCDYKIHKNIGWKYFRKSINGYANLFIHSDHTLYNTNKFYKCIEESISGGKYRSVRYMSGFHIFATRKAARKYKHLTVVPTYKVVLKKVRFREIICKGKQSEQRVIVARYMKILSGQK